MTIVLVGFVAWAIAQLLKIIIELITNARFDLKLLVSSGGMPSSHTALIVSAATRIGLLNGFDSHIFGLSLIMAGIVMYDAVGVRQSVGIQAKALNNINEKISTHTKINEQIKEVCGHTSIQVIFGAILGVLVGLFLFN